jgi:hypothetical protein
MSLSLQLVVERRLNVAGNLTIQLVDPWLEASLSCLCVTVECFCLHGELSSVMQAVLCLISDVI